MTVKDNLNQIEAKIEEACHKSERNRNEITIIGVTKYVTIERTKELLYTGIKNLGENRAEELLHKYDVIKNDEVNWHFIGTLQSRKVKDIIGNVTAIHSLDRTSLAQQINKRTKEKMDCFVQVNISKEQSKHGMEKQEVIPFIKEIKQLEKVNIVGLMTMAPHVTDEHAIRRVFRELRELRDEIQHLQLKNAPCPYLSMGMSNDYHIAIEEGATHIRIGTVLVGDE